MSLITMRNAVRLYSRWRSRKVAGASLAFDENSHVIDITNLRHENESQKPIIDKKDKFDKVKSNYNKNKVIKAEEVQEDIDEELPKLPSDYFLKKVKPIKQATDTPQDDSPKTPKVNEVFDSNGELIYEKLSYKCTKISNLILQTKSAKLRAKSGLISVEGWRLVVDGLQAKCNLKNLIVSNVDDLEKIKPFMPKTGPLIHKMPYNELKAFSDLETSPGIIGIFETPKPIEKNISENTVPVNVVCDNIREPGNLGSVLRVSLGLGCEKIILTKGCADLWNSKVVRSAAGAHFRLPIHANAEWSEIEYLLKDSTVFIADNNSDEDHVGKMKIISSKRNLERDKIISSFKGRKHQLQNVLSEEEKEEEKIPLTPTIFPLLPYYGLDYTNYKSITVIIGGETEGISEDCYRFSHKKHTMRLRVPLTAGVDSLNTGTAFAVIVFEIKRQFLTHEPKVLTYERSSM